MPPSRTSSRQRAHERREATERAILDAATRLLVDRAFRDLAVEDVMSEAGLSRTAFYRYFRDLEHLVLRLLEDVATDLTQATNIWRDSDEPREALRQASAALARIYQRRGPLLLAFEGAAAAGLEVEQAWRRAVNGFVTISARRIEELNSAGKADVSDPTETARALVWMTERYLLEVFGRPGAAETPIDSAVAVLAIIWERALALT
ncbi:MAG: TetR/AcrR family transcriptional regulator [Acidimicrobiales bacterium]